MYLHYFIFFLFLFVLGGMLWYFYSKKKMAESEHLQTLAQLHDALTTNSEQIAVRKLNLRKYNFLTYNLKDALVLQPQIKLNTI